MLDLATLPLEQLEALKFGAESYKRGVEDAKALITPALDQLIQNMNEQIAQFDAEFAKRNEKRIITK